MLKDNPVTVIRNEVINPVTVIINEVIKPIENIRLVIGDSLSYCNSFISTIDTIDKYSSVVIKGLETLKIIPKSANVQKTLDDVFTTYKMRLKKTISIVYNTIENILESFENIYHYIYSIIKEKINQIENVIRSTIMKYTNVFHSALDCIEKSLYKMQHYIDKVQRCINGMIECMVGNILTEISNAVDMDKFSVSEEIVRPILGNVLGQVSNVLNSAISNINIFNSVYSTLNNLRNYIYRIENGSLLWCSC